MKKRSILHRIRDPYNNFRRGANNRMPTLSRQSQMMTQPNMAGRFHDFLNSMPDITNIHHQNPHFTNNTYQAAPKPDNMHITSHH